MARGHVAAELGVVSLAVGAEFKVQRRGRRRRRRAPAGAGGASSPTGGAGCRGPGGRSLRIQGSGHRCGRCRGGLAGNGPRPRCRQASGKGSEPGPGRAQQSRQPARTDGTVLLPLASGGPAMGHHSRPQGGRKGVILPWGPGAAAGGGSVCPVGSLARARSSAPRSLARRISRYQQPPNPPGPGRLGGGVDQPERRR